MATKREPGAKDPATKNTLNPPNRQARGRKSSAPTPERSPGQYSGEGTPPLMKK